MGGCDTSRRSRRLSRPLAAGLRGRENTVLLAATLLLVRRYGDGVACRIGVRRAAWSKRDDTVPLVGVMPAATTLATHLCTVSDLLARDVVDRAGDGEPDRLVCVLDGPADGWSAADLVVSGAVTADDVTVHVDHHEHVYGAAFVDRLLDHLVNLVRELVERPDTPIGAVRMLTTEEEARLRTLNDTSRRYPRDAAIYDLFVAQAQAGPSRVAVRTADGPVTYRELEERALRLARVLYTHGVRRHDRVAFQLAKSPLLLTAVLAILRLGAAYVPIDPGIPVNRRDFLLTDSGAQLLLVDSAGPDTVVPVLDLTGEHDLTALEPLPAVIVSPLDTAYVMYTSGSTGRPKGVLVNQRAVVRLVRDTDYVELSPATTVLQTGAIAFDATTFEFWGALLNGGALALEPMSTVLEPASLRAAIDRHGVTTMFLTTTLFHQLVEEDPTVFAGCQVLVGGEMASPRHFARAVARCPQGRFVHVYGPTENTTFSTGHRVDREYRGRVPVGRPIANSTAWVLDPDGHPRPFDVPGELYLGGDGLSDGYLDRPDLTDRAFVTHPTEGRLYRTGDVARWRADGLLEIIGRIDHQVKIRGFRVELAEVESRIRDVPGVREAAVLLARLGDGMSVLRAYYTAVPPVEPARLRATLHEELPEYMVPSTFQQLDEMPRNRSLKIDRAALAALEPVDDDSDRTGRPPRTPQEKAVARVFAEVLGRAEVSVDDDFFDLGGHSLRAMRLWSRLRSTLGVEIELRQLLDAPTVAGIVANLRAAPAPTVPRPRLVRRS
ncbi:non-ribosomal peptide synthetase [Micromonospora sp. WMMD987]|uniref:non-ribosomal peptide synthetase n=1 Tax=Micromonospora sp. WMMD987 TaxID=3016089 RepID=UPI00249A1C87|nr:non-ribosomal peptide synthetase [Micromonospora sp. WMMD987]WFE96160.1 non-ribosomal peptide synthetase [Micromonospora sp. WMMD987]